MTWLLIKWGLAALIACGVAMLVGNLIRFVWALFTSLDEEGE